MGISGVAAIVTIVALIIQIFSFRKFIMRSLQNPSGGIAPAGDRAISDTAPADASPVPAGTTRGFISRADASALRARLGNGFGAAGSIVARTGANPSPASSTPVECATAPASGRQPALLLSNADPVLPQTPQQGATPAASSPLADSSGAGALPPGFERPVLRRQSNLPPPPEDRPGSTP